MVMELIVYHDEDYPTWWISRNVSKKIVNFLKSKGFIEYNATDLAKWMEKIIDKNKCYESVVVFSQDIVPGTIYERASPSSLLRTYLDCGGKIVWMGDTPLYYRGMHASSLSEFKDEVEKNEEKRKQWLVDREGKVAKKYGRDGPFNVLGVMPAYIDFPSSKVTVTTKGKALRLQTPWYSLRPIIIMGRKPTRQRTTVLAKASKPLTRVPTKKIHYVKDVMEKEKPIRLPSLIEFMSKFVGLIITAVTASSALFTLLAGYSLQLTLSLAVIAITSFLVYVVYWHRHWKETLASAWWKNYNEKYPTSGFIRIWDCDLERVTEEMLEELYNVSIIRN